MNRLQQKHSVFEAECNVTIHERFQRLPIDPCWIGLERGDRHPKYFCTPLGAQIIGWENSIHYRFLPGYGEMVFAVNPESCADAFVYPLAKDFSDFLRLILACGSTTAAEQIILWDRESFERFLHSDDNAILPQQARVLEVIREQLHLMPMEDSFDCVKALQAQCGELSLICCSDEYYDTLGLPRPTGRSRRRMA